MPSIEITKIMLDDLTANLNTKAARAQDCFDWLDTYDYNGVTGPMPAFTYQTPTAVNIEYDPTESEILIDGTRYSLSSDSEKTTFFTYQRQFVREGILQYIRTYNL